MIYIYIYIHRRRKILKVGGAHYVIVRIARAKIFDHAHFFARSKLLRTYSQEFLDERTNSKSSRVNLAATYSHIDSSSGLVGLRMSVSWQY